jgi:nicotinate-nucleotide adenylyltransferase
MIPLAIFGGTFDPVHIGHLRVAWEAAEALDAEVRMMPAHVPPHRLQPQASAAHRLAMLQAALAGQSRLAVDQRELSRHGPSYTVDTLRELRQEIGPQRPLLLLVGADAYAGLPTWHDWLELYALAHLVVLTRPGHPVEWSGVLALETRARQVGTAASLREVPAGRVLELAVTPLEVSASHVRAEFAAGREPRYLVPNAVLAYIRAHDLYGGA